MTKVLGAHNETDEKDTQGTEDGRIQGSSGMSSGGKAGVRPAMFSRLEETGVSAAANGGRAWL